MKPRRLITQVAALGTLGLWVAACATDPPRELTESEAMTIAEMMGATVVDPAVEETVGAIPFFGRADPQGLDYEHEVDCPEGGTAALSGTVDVQIDDSSFSANSEGSVDFDSCAGRTYEDDVVALTGGIDFALAIVATVSLSERVVYISAEGSAEGSLEWEIAEEGESGVCEVDVALDVDIELRGGFPGGEFVVEGGVTGTVCGHDVDFDAADLEFWS